MESNQLKLIKIAKMFNIYETTSFKILHGNIETSKVNITRKIFLHK